MAGGMRGWTRRDVLRAGGAAIVVVGASAAGCDAGSGDTRRGRGGGSRAQDGSVSAFPLPGTPTASARTTISFRGISPGKAGKVTVTGSGTGKHSGEFRRHQDGKGVTFVPAKPFEAGEQVTVRTGMDVRGADDGRFRFRIARPFEASESAGGSDGSGGSEGEGAPPVRSFSSRPELQPPQLEVVQPAGQGVAAGYVFVAPKKPRENTTQEGPMILDNDGEVVWFHPLDKGTEAMDFKVQKLRGKDVLTWWQGTVGPGYGMGEYVIVDSGYEEITRVTAGNGYGGDLHDFRITPEGTALLMIYSPVEWEESGGESRPVLDGVIQEVDIDSGDVLFEWHALADISLDESYGDVIADPADVFDYVHHNSVDIDSDGHLLVSGRHTRTVYKIDRGSGAIMWRLGGKKSDFTMGRGTEFAYQHDARRRPDGTLTIFDNAAGSEESAVRESSRGIVLKLDTQSMRASLVREYQHPDGILSHSQANMQVLPNGNVFLGWGSAPAFTEHSKDGTVLFDVRLPEEVESYRAFRFPWRGRPGGKPAIAAEPSGDGALTVSASWNGATEVAAWQVLAGPGESRLEPVGRKDRDGFETRIDVTSDAPRVAVRALDSSGNELGTSPTVATGP